MRLLVRREIGIFPHSLCHSELLIERHRAGRSVACYRAQESLDLLELDPLPLQVS